MFKDDVQDANDAIHRTSAYVFVFTETNPERMQMSIMQISLNFFTLYFILLYIH